MLAYLLYSVEKALAGLSLARLNLNACWGMLDHQMQYDILVLPNGEEGKKYKFEFEDRNGVTRSILFIIGGKEKPAEFLDDLVKSLKEYKGRPDAD